MKYLLGLLSLIPLLVALYTVALMFGMITDVAAAGGSASPTEWSGNLQELMGVQVAGLVVALGLMVFFFWHLLVKRAAEDPTQRLLWGLAILFAGAIAMPIYWYFEFVEKPTRLAAKPAGA